MTDWYEENIEQGVRDLVRLLRNNGVNTTCSCEHERYVQCDYMADWELFRIHHLLVNEGYTDFSIELHIEIRDGYWTASFIDIRLL